MPSGAWQFHQLLFLSGSVASSSDDVVKWTQICDNSRGMENVLKYSFCIAFTEKNELMSQNQHWSHPCKNAIFSADTEF